jgi:hypothetical protein
MRKKWLSEKEEKERSLKKFFIAIKTKKGWTTVSFKIKNESEIENYLRRNEDSILDCSPPWRPLLN